MEVRQKMNQHVHLLVGTRKGGFVVENGSERRRWKVRGPYLGGQNVMHMSFDSRSGTMLAAAWDPWFGSRVYRSFDMGHNWDEPKAGPAFPEGSGQKLEKVWHVQPGRPEEPRVVYAGVEPAALFKSTDDGRSWSLGESLSNHPTRKDWQPGAGGLCLHTILLDPNNTQRMYTAISAAGVFRTEDGGASWQPSNTGARADFVPDQPPVYPEWGQCVHKMVQHPAKPERLYQQNHCGVYRSDDGGANWIEITAGLPSEWGLPIALHPQDPDCVYVCPGTSAYRHWMPDGRLAVYRTREKGGSWEKLTKGLAQRHAYLNVLRDGMATDTLDPCGVYVGANTGQLFFSADEGDSWRRVPAMFPPITSVETIVL